MTGLAELAADAYLSGWALTDAPWTPRVEAGCLAAVQTALDFPADPGVLEATMHLGHLTGIWQTIYDRRARLQARHERAVAAAWNACLKDLDPAELVRRFRRDAYLPAETAVKDPTKSWWRDVAVTAALGWLRGIYHTDGYPALVAALEDAIRSGMAEGEAGALALAASRIGRTGFRIDQAFKTAYGRLAADHRISQKAADSVTSLINWAAGDVGRHLASMTGDGKSEDEMTADVEDMTTGQDSQAVTQGSDRAVWAGILAGAVALYSRMSGDASSLPVGGPDTPAPPQPPPDAGPILLDWISAGDSRVCPTCSGYEDNSPYTPEQVPAYPHGRCRCSVDLTADTRYTSLLGALLDSFAN
jgi:hypothetical protein